MHSTITSDEWFCHFYEVFNSDNTDVETSVDDSVTNEVVSDTLEADITQLEVPGAIKEY